MPGSWEKRRRGRSVVWAALALVLVVLSAVIVRNNLDLVRPREGRSSDGNRPGPTFSTADVSSAPQLRGSVSDSPGYERDGAGGSDADEGPRESSDLASVELTDVRCAVADDPGLTLIVSLKLLFRDPELRDELMAKRQNLDVMVQKAFAERRLSEIVVDDLRAELVRLCNLYLESGTLSDIEFVDFRPVRQE